MRPYVATVAAFCHWVGLSMLLFTCSSYMFHDMICWLLWGLCVNSLKTDGSQYMSRARRAPYYHTRPPETKLMAVEVTASLSSAESNRCVLSETA